MSLISLLEKIPNTHLLPSNTLRGELINQTYLLLSKRADLNFTHYEYKLLAILLTGLDTDSFTAAELESLLSVDWNRLEVLTEMRQNSQLSPSQFQMETALSKKESPERYRKRKFASLRQYIINGV